jgi:hypothetical protein
MSTLNAAIQAFATSSPAMHRACERAAGGPPPDPSVWMQWQRRGWCRDVDGESNDIELRWLRWLSFVGRVNPARRRMRLAGISGVLRRLKSWGEFTAGEPIPPDGARYLAQWVGDRAVAYAVGIRVAGDRGGPEFVALHVDPAATQSAGLDGLDRLARSLGDDLGVFPPHRSWGPPGRGLVLIGRGARRVFGDAYATAWQMRGHTATFDADGVEPVSRPTDDANEE